MWKANPTWGSPKIVAELAMLGIDVAKSTVEKYQPKRTGPPSATWRTFLDQHIWDLVSIDFFIVPTARFRVLFVFIMLAHDRVPGELIVKPLWGAGRSLGTYQVSLD